MRAIRRHGGMRAHPNGGSKEKHAGGSWQGSGLAVQLMGKRYNFFWKSTERLIMSAFSHARAKLFGTSSWLCILGASFFWVWLDRGMFGSTLLFSASHEAVEMATTLMLLANIVGFVAVWLFVRMRQSANDATIWSQKTVIIAAAFGVFGGALCLPSSGSSDFLFLCFGGVCLGLSMSILNVIWGILAVSQGVEKAVLHISGAWGISLIHNLLLALMPNSLESMVVMLLPAFSLCCYRVLYRLQWVKRYTIVFKHRQEEAPAKGSKVFGADLPLLVMVLIFCSTFGFVSWFAPAGQSVLAELDPDFLSLGRCALALLFFVVCCFTTLRRVELLLQISLSLVGAGAIVLTISLFLPEMSESGQLLVAIGYAGFDILVWLLISYYSHVSILRSIQVIAVVMVTEQIGILFGLLSNITVAHVGLGQFELSIFLVAINYTLVLACLALMRRFDTRLILSDNAPAETALSSESYCAVDSFSERYDLTPREKQVAYYLAEGRNVPFIAKKLSVSENTVKSHVRHIYEKSDVHDRQELLDALETIRHH